MPWVDKLRLATALLNQRFAGARLDEIKRQIIDEMESDRQSIDSYMQATMELASKVFEDEDEPAEEYVVAGESRLMGSASPEELERLQELFEAPYFCKTQQYKYLDLAKPLVGNPLVERFARLAAELEQSVRRVALGSKRP